MAFRNYILCFALVAGTIAGPINVQDAAVKCASTCTESLSDNAKFQYTPGNTYVYTYEGTTETKIHGSSSQSTTLKIETTAHIEVLSQCEFALKLRDVSLSENGVTSSGSQEFKQKLERSTLRFAFQDGKIEEVCSGYSEDERVLNVKRAVLSTFQNSQVQLNKNGLFTETDISGTCPTKYESDSGIFGGLTITKTKDILACVDRNGNISSIHSKRYLVPSKVQSLPLLKSTLVCKQEISSKMIEKTTCSEELMFRPFSQGENGAVTKATQSLTYQSVTKSITTSQVPVERKSSLLFHHIYDESIDSEAKTEVIDTLKKICAEVSDEITRDSPILFGTLVSHMKRLSTEKMLEVYTAINGDRVCDKNRGKQFFFDAIPMVATEASVSMMTKLITDRTIDGAEAEVWLTQLAFIPRPNYSMLTAVKPLLKDEAYKNRALLGVSAMVHKLCDNYHDCAQHTEVANFIRRLEDNIGKDCDATSTEQRNIILITLKSLGNAGDAITSSAVIGRCINNNNADMEVRIAALQAYGRVPCTVSREEAMRLYQNADNDAELRIHAFLSVMTCPSNSVLTKVRMMLSGEPVNQVGSFVWTYLENLKETSAPLKQELASILEDVKLREDFNSDVRKFSRNIEKSFFSEYLNAGAQVESNLIWSQKSYIPRSAMLNVTVEMFGNSINLLEVGGRVQGLEKIVEKFFGPEGYFSKKNTRELIESKRQTANYISSFDKMFKTPDDKITTSMYTKVFGNEILFQELTSNDWSELQQFNILEALIKLAEPKKIDITKNYQFMDSSLIVPTCIGLPMNLTVNGSASVSIDVNGNVDLRNFAASPRNLDINGHIKPSAAVVVSGLMGVDALVTKSSMKMVATMHTSTMLDGKIQLKDGEVFNVELNTPQEKMEIFHVQTEFFMNGEKMQMPEAAFDFKKCSSPMFTSVVGMEMCVDVTLPSTSGHGLPLAPFTGPMNAQVFIEKKDTHSSYAFTVKHQNERSQVSGNTYTKRTMHISLDTPGSQVDRKLLAEAIFDPASMAASAQLMTPWKKFSWTGSLENEVSKKKAMVVMKIDENKEYSIDAEVGVEKKNVKTVYTPSLSIVMPNRPTMSVSGNFEMGSGKSVVAADLKILKFTRKPITFTTALTKIKGGQSYKFDLDLNSDYLTTSIDSSVAITGKNYNGRAVLEYSIDGRPKHRFSTSGKFSDNSIGDLNGYSVQFGFIPTEYPQYSVSLDTDLEFATDYVDAKLTVDNNDQKLIVTHKTTKQGDWKALTVDSESTLKYPSLNVNMEASMKHKHDEDMIQSSASVTYAPSKIIKASINLDRKVANTYKGEVTLGYPGRDMSLETTTSQMSDGKRKMTVNSQWANDANSKASMSSSWKSGETHEISAEITIPGHPVTIKASIKPNPVDFMGEVDVTYNRNTYSLSSGYKLSEDSITSTASWVCPHKTITYEMSGTLTEKKALYDAELKWATDKKVKVSAAYNNLDNSMTKRDASLRVDSPWVSFTTNSDFEMTGKTAGHFNWQLSHGSEKCELKAKLNEASAEITVNSPFIQYGPIKSLHAKYNIYQNSADAEFSWAPSHKITGSTTWSKSKYTVTVSTPFESYQTMKAEVMPATKTSPFKADLNVDANKMDLSVNYPDFTRGSFSYTLGKQTGSASFNQNGQIDKFEGDVEMVWNAKKLWSKLSLNTKGPYTASLDITTPFDIEKISATFNHEGQLMDFTTRGSLTWNDNQLLSTLKFAGKSAELTVRSPWENISAKYSVNGELKAFTSSSTISWGENNIKAACDFDITNGKLIKTSFSLETPFYNTVSGEMDYTGELIDHRGETTLVYGDSSIKLAGKLSLVNGLKYNAELSNPWTDPITIAASHSGSLASWTNSASYSMGTAAPVTIYSEFTSDKLYSGKAGVKNSPHKYLPNGEASFNYKTMNTMTTAVATVTYMEDQTVTATVSLDKKNGCELTASLKTPYTEDYSLHVTHSGDNKSMQNTAIVQWSPTDKITTVTTINTRYGFDGKMSIDSPWRKMSFSAKQQGTSQEFSASTNLSWAEGKEISSTLEFSQISELKASWSLKTPFDEVKDMSSVFTHRGTSYDKFYSQIEGKLNGEEITVGMNWDMTSDIALTINCENPWKSFNLASKYTGEPKDFTVTSSFKLASDTYSTSLKFECDSNIKIELDVTPVVIEPIRFELSSNGVENSASLTWGDKKTISADAKYADSSYDNTKEVEINFITPFEGFESGHATLKHTGTLEAFRETGQVAFYGKKASAEFGFTSFGEYKGDFDLDTPWYSANGRFQHSGDMSKFDNMAELTYAADKKIRTEGSWSMKNGVKAEWSMTSPFKNIEAKWSHEMDGITSATAHAELSLDSVKQFESDVSFTNKPGNIVADYTLNSLWKSVTAKYTHQGTWETRCNGKAELGWDDEKQFTADWKISMVRGFSAEADVKTPWENVSGHVEHQGTKTDFTNTISITCSEKTVKLETEFKMQPDFFVKSTLTSPWTKSSGSYRHSGTLKNFACHLEGNMDDLPITGDLSWNMINGIQTSVSVDTPWKDVSGEFETNYDLEDLSSTVKLDWEDDKLDANVAFKAKTGYEGSFTANTPWKNVDAQFSGQGTIKNFAYEASTSWAADRKIAAKASFTTTSSSRSSSVTVNTPWKNVSANYRSSGTMKNFDSKVDFTWETDKTVSLEAKMNAESSFSTEWIIKSPWKNLSADMQYSGSVESLTSSANLSWEPTKKISVSFTNTMLEGSMNTAAKIESPWKNLEFTYTRTGTWESVSTTTEFIWEPTKKISCKVDYNLTNGFDGKAVLETPWKNIETTAKFEGELTDFTSDFSYTCGHVTVSSALTFSMLPFSATWNFRYPEYNMDYSLTSSGDSSNMKGETSFSFKDKTYKLAGGFDLRSGYKGDITITLPGRIIAADFTHTGELKDFSSSANLSWADDKLMTFSSSFKMADTISGSFRFTCPYTEAITGEFTHKCSDLTLETSGELSWAPMKKIEASINFSNESSMTGDASLKTPFTEPIAASFEHNGEMMDFNNKASFSWAADKKVEGTANFKYADNINGAVTLNTPFAEPMAASFEHNGDMMDFNNKASFSWAADKKVEGTANFKYADNINGAVTLNTPFAEPMAASFEHNGEMMDFNNKASLSWAADKKVEGTANFKYADSINAEATLKTPFFDEMELQIDSTLASGEMTVKLPYIEKTEAKFSFTDKLNWNVELDYGTEKFVVRNAGSMESGLNLNSAIQSPMCNLSLSINHSGDYTDFTNSVEGKYNEKTAKLTTIFDMANRKVTQTLDFTGYERMNWSAECSYTETSFTADAEFSYGAKKVELDLTSGVEWKKFKSVISSTIVLKTPFADFEDNKLDASLEYSPRLFDLTLDGYKGAPANIKKFQLYKKMTKTSFEAFLKSSLLYKEESVVSLNMNVADSKYTLSAVNDLKYSPESKFNAKMEVNHSRTSAGLSHSGSLELTCSDGTRKLEWNAGSSQTSCETGLTYTSLGETAMTYSHKTTWNAEYTNLSQDVIFKSPFDGFKDCEMKVAYDFTQPKKTVTLTMFNDPTSPYDFKTELQTEDALKFMADLSTPLDMAKKAKIEVDINMASQPWTVKVDGSLNEQTFSSEGHMEVNREGKVDTSLKFESQIPRFESLQLTISNTKMNEQYKPHVVIQWASDKKIEMSGTFSWTSTYKMNVDINTPFNSMKSLVTDITINCNMPDSMDMSFEFQTNKMSNKLSGKMNFNKATSTLTVSAESPFEAITSFQITAALKPRMSLVVKRNGETVFNLSGNGSFESLKSHNLELTATYPFWNEYMHLKVNNDLSLSDDNMLMDVEFEYMRGQEITFKYTLATTPKTNIHVAFTSPFEMIENIKYGLSYEGTPQNWKESTELEFYYGKVTTNSNFNMVNGITFHQTTNGEMKNGMENFNMKEDFVFTGDLSQFDVEASMTGSFLPTISYSTNWSYDPIKMSVKATMNEYHAELSHEGDWTDLTCSYHLKGPMTKTWYGDETNEWEGNWTFKYTDRISYVAQFKFPEKNKIDMNFDLGMLDGKTTMSLVDAEHVAEITSSYSRSESPYKYDGMIKMVEDDKTYETGLTLTESTLDWPIKYNGEERVGLHISNELTSDMEYKPVIKLIDHANTYEFDGLYKNEGEGLIRDFKLHMNGPRGTKNGVDMKFEFQTQSAQLVPGEAKFFLAHTRTGKDDNTLLDMNANWGNDRAVVKFVEPRPMKYSIDFSVDTKGQSGEINANWDTSAADKNFQMKFLNKFVASSRRLKSMIDIDVVYTGISRGFASTLDWKEETVAHKLTLDYNGKEIGYDWKLDHSSGGCDCSLELISEWRNVKGTWTDKVLSDGRELSYGLYWDVTRDATKKFTGVSKWEKTAQNTYTWTSTFSHPALSKDMVITDVIIYDTSKYVFSLSKNWSFSTDSSKDVQLTVAMEQSGKWGVELKQDFNKVDMKLGTEFSGNGANGHFIYKATDGTTKNFGFETSYADSNKALVAKFTTPMKTFELSTEKTRSSWTATLKVGQDVYQATVTVRPEDSYLLAKLTCPHSNDYQFEATSIENGYQMQLSRKVEGTMSTDALVAVSMNENRTVNGKLYWNPAMYTDIKSKIAVVRADVKTLMKKMSKAGVKEATTKLNSLQLGSDFDRLMSHYETEADAFRQDIQVAKQKISEAYELDVFYMQTITEIASEIADELMEEFAAVEKNVVEFYDEFIAPNLPAIDAEEIKEKLAMKLAAVEARIVKFRSTMSDKWEVECEKIARAMKMVADYLEATLNKVAEYVHAHPATETLKKVHSATMSKFNQVSDMAYSQVSGLTDPQLYADALYSAHDYMSTTLVNSRLTDYVSARTISGISDSVMYKLQHLYKYYDVADNVKMFIKHSRNIAAEYLNDYLNHYIDELLHDFQWKQYDLENGRIEIELNIPTRYNSVQFARVKADLKHRLDSLFNHMAKYHFNVKEMFYMYKPKSFGDILPPYSAQAIISGQHIRTFDRRHFDFRSDSCSYLLARDFQDGNFTVFVNYNNGEQSLTVHSNGMVIDIASDNSVKLDGSKVELPLQNYNTTVTRRGHLVVVSSTLGVEVVCDHAHEYCTVEMSGFYFAKTGGLFGTYNNEPLDDFMTSENKNVTDVLEFTNSWTSSCTGTNKAETFKAEKDTKEYNACAAVFKDSSSSLQPCFAVVDPMDAFHKCINDMGLDVTLTDKNGPCKAAKFYEMECKFAGVTVYEPSQCVTCDMGETSISQYESYSLPEHVMAADIVFVVEEKMCNYDTDSKLPMLSKLIDSALSGNGYTDIRYGLVGFGGQDVHEPSHVHTMDNKMFAKQNEFKLGTDALKFGDGKNKDVFEAVDFAAQYPFRTGATKVIVVIPCSDCSESALSYNSLTSRLVSEDITLHVINEFSYDITVEGKNPATNNLFGIDNSAVFTLRDSRTLRGNQKLYPITSKPTDHCSSLALQTGGTVFDLNMMTKMRGRTVKSFQTVFANRMAMTTFPATCTTCTCEYNEMFSMPRSVCRRC